MGLNLLTWQRCLVNLGPSGTLEITENGEYDVSHYATADVNVSGGQVDVGNDVVLFATVDDIGVGDQATFANYNLTGLYYDDVALAALNSTMGSSNIAANLTVEIEFSAETFDGFYLVTLDETDKYTSMEQLTIEHNYDAGILTFTMPDLTDDPDNPAILFIQFTVE